MGDRRAAVHRRGAPRSSAATSASPTGAASDRSPCRRCVRRRVDPVALHAFPAADGDPDGRPHRPLPRAAPPCRHDRPTTSASSCSAARSPPKASSKRTAKCGVPTASSSPTPASSPRSPPPNPSATFAHSTTAGPSPVSKRWRGRQRTTADHLVVRHRVGKADGDPPRASRALRHATGRRRTPIGCGATPTRRARWRDAASGYARSRWHR